VFRSDREVTDWFVGMQSVAPLTVYHMRRAVVLWHRVFMKLNAFGLKPIHWPSYRAQLAAGEVV
jgi:hypothetical protein